MPASTSQDRNLAPLFPKGRLELWRWFVFFEAASACFGVYTWPFAFQRRGRLGEAAELLHSD